MPSRRRLAIDEILSSLEKNGGRALVGAPDARRLANLIRDFGLDGKIMIANNRRKRKSVVIEIDVVLPELKLPEL